LERVPGVVIGERRENHAQGIGLVTQGRGAWREHALARGAAPELDDLKLLGARAAARKDVTAAVRTGFRLLDGERDAGDAGEWRHTRDKNVTVSRRTKIEKYGSASAHGNWKHDACGLDAGRLTDFDGVAAGGARR
jgi:hypothetical protein